MKTIYKTIALFLTVFTINTGALLAEERKSETDNVLNTEIENEILVENWMTNISEWSVNYYTSEQIFEAEIVIENWMIDANPVNWEKSDIISELEEVEDDIKIEDWMNNPSKW